MGAGDLNLTLYQRAFLTHLVAFCAPTIVIGGKARAFHSGALSTDLDLWMPAHSGPDSTVHRCLISWSQRYPNHSWPPLTEPLELTTNHMVQFPNADVWFQADNGEVESVTESVRIDILFGLAGFSFEDAYCKAVKWPSGGSTVRILSKDLLEPTAALKPAQ